MMGALGVFEQLRDLRLGETQCLDNLAWLYRDGEQRFGFVLCPFHTVVVSSESRCVFPL